MNDKIAKTLLNTNGLKPYLSGKVDDVDQCKIL